MLLRLLLIISICIAAPASYIIQPSGKNTTSTLLDYASGSQFTYTSSQVEFTNGSAKIANQNGSSAYFVACFHTSVAGDWSRNGGDLTATQTTGSFSITGGKLDVSGASNKQLNMVAALNVPMGKQFSVRLKVTPNYSGTPASSQEFYTTMFNNADDTNDVRIHHDTDGKLYFDAKGLTGNKQVSAAWSPTSGTEYELLWVVDMTNGTYHAYKDGSTWGTSASGAQGRHNWIDYFQFAQPYVNINANSNYYLRDLILYDSILQSGASYTPGYTCSSTPYLTTDPTITQTTGVVAAGLVGFSAGSSASGSDSVKFCIDVDGTKYWYSSGWVSTTTCDSTHANSASTIDTNAATLVAGTYKVIAVLHSNDGSTTPSLGSVMMVTD